MKGELILFATSIILGMIYAFIYSTLLINREKIKYIKFIEYVEDIIYSIVIIIFTISLIVLYKLFSAIKEGAVF